MNNQTDLVPRELTEKIKKVFGDSLVLIASHSRPIRNNLKKVLIELGFSINQICVVENYKTAKEQLEANSFAIVLSSCQLEGGTVRDLRNLHFKLHPNRIKSLFFIVTELQHPYLGNIMHDWNIDGVLTGVQSFQNTLNFISCALQNRLSLSKSDILLYKLKELISLQEHAKAKAFLEAAHEISLDEFSKNKILGEIEIFLGNEEEGFNYLKKAIELKDTDYNSLMTLIQLTSKRKELVLTHRYALRFIELYVPLPNDLPNFLKILLVHNDYIKIVKLCETYQDEDIDAHIKLNIAAALALCGKNLIQTKPQTALDALNQAINISGQTSFNIFQMVIGSLSEIIEQKEHVLKLIDKHRTYYGDSKPFLTLEFEILSKYQKPTDIFDFGLELLKKDIKSFNIYSCLIDASIELGRRKEAIEDLVFEACREFPDYSAEFKNYLT